MRTECQQAEVVALLPAPAHPGSTGHRPHLSRVRRAPTVRPIWLRWSTASRHSERRSRASTGPGAPAHAAGPRHR